MRNIGDPIVAALNAAQISLLIPAKYEHTLIISTELFIKLWSTETIDFPYYQIESTIHFQERNGIINISFTTLKACNEVHIKALEFVVREKTNSIPIIRTYRGSMQTNTARKNGNRS